MTFCTLCGALCVLGVPYHRKTGHCNGIQKKERSVPTYESFPAWRDEELTFCAFRDGEDEDEEEELDDEDE